MSQAAFDTFELLTVILFGLCLWHAARRDRFHVAELVAGLLYGVFLEWMTLRQLEAYTYGQFRIMFDGAPLAIGLGWAVIIYSAMQFTRQLDLPVFVRPLLAGLLALNLDVSMDVIAIRLGFWTWGVGLLDFEWFGVPWGNFWAWFIVVSSYAGFLEMLTLYGWQRSPVRRWLYVPLAVILSSLVLAVTNDLFRSLLWPNQLGFTGMLVLVGSALLLVLRARPRLRLPAALDPVVFAVPLAFHGFFTAAGVISGIYAHQPILAAIGVLMATVGIALHLWPWWASRPARAPVSS